MRDKLETTPVTKPPNNPRNLQGRPKFQLDSSYQYVTELGYKKT